MGKIIQEKQEIINKILNEYFKNQKLPHLKKCKNFNPQIMTLYIENKLSREERLKFEKHLFKCKYCNTIYTNIENEIKILFKAKVAQISDKILKESFSFLEKQMKNLIKEKTTSLIVKLKKEGLEIIEAVNVKNLKVSPLPVLRDKKLSLAKKILITKKFNEFLLEISLIHKPDNTITLKILFQSSKKKVYTGIIELISKNKNIEIAKRIINNKVGFENLPIGEYKIYIDNKIIGKLKITHEEAA